MTSACPAGPPQGSRTAPRSTLTATADVTARAGRAIRAAWLSARATVSGDHRARPPWLSERRQRARAGVLCRSVGAKPLSMGRSESAIFRWRHGISITHRDRRRACRGPGRTRPPGHLLPAAARPVTPRAALGGQGTALVRRPARRQRHGRPPGTAPVRPHHSAEPSGYAAACGRQGRRASGVQQRTGRDP